MIVLDTEESLYGFLQEYGGDQVKRELLLFWSMHPNARFDHRAICYTLDCNKPDVERALSTMVEEGLLDKNTGNGVTLYSLATKGGKRQAVLALATLTWDRWRLMLMPVEQTAK